MSARRKKLLLVEEVDFSSRFVKKSGKLIFFLVWIRNIILEEGTGKRILLPERRNSMAIHNQVRLVGYLLKDPTVQNEGKLGEEKVLVKLRTCRREIDGYNERNFEDLLIFYDGTEMMQAFKGLVQYDVVDIKGVVNILPSTKRTRCPFCGHVNLRYNKLSTFVYPISMHKVQSMKSPVNLGQYDPENICFWLQEQYREVSNQVLLIGTVCSEPKMIGTEKNPCCRYQLGINRKYYIPTQADITADYPWVYTYGQQAEWDSTYLHVGSEILVDGVMRNEEISPAVTCEECGALYKYRDTRSSFVPYSLEYLANYLTDKEIQEMKEAEIRKAIMNN